MNSVDLEEKLLGLPSKWQEWLGRLYFGLPDDIRLIMVTNQEYFYPELEAPSERNITIENYLKLDSRLWYVLNDMSTKKGVKTAKLEMLAREAVTSFTRLRTVIISAMDNIHTILNEMSQKRKLNWDDVYDCGWAFIDFVSEKEWAYRAYLSIIDDPTVDLTTGWFVEHLTTYFDRYRPDEERESARQAFYVNLGMAPRPHDIFGICNAWFDRVEFRLPNSYVYRKETYEEMLSPMQKAKELVVTTGCTIFGDDIFEEAGIDIEDAKIQLLKLTREYIAEYVPSTNEKGISFNIGDGDMMFMTEEVSKKICTANVVNGLSGELVSVMIYNEKPYEMFKVKNVNDTIYGISLFPTNEKDEREIIEVAVDSNCTYRFDDEIDDIASGK